MITDGITVGVKVGDKLGNLDSDLVGCPDGSSLRIMVGFWERDEVGVALSIFVGKSEIYELGNIDGRFEFTGESDGAIDGLFEYKDGEGEGIIVVEKNKKAFTGLDED